MINIQGQERPVPKITFRSGNGVTHLGNFAHVIRVTGADHDVLGSVLETGKGGIYIKGTLIRHIAGHQGTREEIDVIQCIHQTGCIIEILQGGWSLFTRFQIKNMGRGTARARVDIGTAQNHLVFRLLTGKHNRFRQARHGAFDQFTWKTESAVIGFPSPGTGNHVGDGLRRVAEASFSRIVRAARWICSFCLLFSNRKRPLMGMNKGPGSVVASEVREACFFRLLFRC